MKKQYLFICLFFIGIVVLTSCKSEADNYPSVSGKVDPASIEKASIIAYFPFESKAYTTVKSYGIDSSKVTFGDSASFVLGQRGYCFRGNAVKSHIQCNLLANNAYQKLKGFTIASWVKLPAITDNAVAQLVMINGGDTISGAGSLSLSYDAQYLSGYVYSDSIPVKAHEIKVERSLIKTDEWVHLVFTYDDSTSALALYANGVLLKEDICYTDPAAATKVPMGGLKLAQLKMTKLYIGAWPQQVLGTASATMKYFTGYLDEMRVWKKGLSKEAVGNLYQAELSQARNQ